MDMKSDNVVLGVTVEHRGVVLGVLGADKIDRLLQVSGVTADLCFVIFPPRNCVRLVTSWC